MSREKGRRTWIKLHTYGRLHGSVVHQLEEAEQSVWDKILCLAGEINLDGLISDNDRRPFPHSFIASEIHTTLELFESTLKKCMDEGRLSEDEHGIQVVNWSKYQSEYQRQQPYRKGEPPGKKSYKKCPICGWHRATAEKWCPDCEKKGEDVELVTDYEAGPLGSIARKRMKEAHSDEPET